MYLIVTNAGRWARDDSVYGAFQTLVQLGGSTPTHAIFYEFETDDPKDVWVDEMGWVRSKEGILPLREKHFDPRPIYKAYSAFDEAIDEVIWS